jgi:alpha-L-fucosidase 2
MNWNNGKLGNAALFSRQGGECTVRTNHPVTLSGLNIKSKKSTIGYVLTFKASKGKTYQVIAQ